MKTIRNLFFCILSPIVMSSCLFSSGEAEVATFRFDYINQSDSKMYTSVYCHRTGDTTNSKSCIIRTYDPIEPFGTGCTYAYIGRDMSETWAGLFSKENADTIYVVISSCNYDIAVGDQTQMPSDSTVLDVFKFTPSSVDLNGVSQTIVYTH